MKRLGVIAAGCVGALSLSAEAAVIQFNYTGVLANYDPIPQTEGDITNLDVTNRTRQGFGNSAISFSYASYWESGYASPSLIGVAFPAASGYVSEFEFAPDPGYTVTISSFEVGTYFNGPPVTNTFSIYDSAWNLLWTTGAKVYDGDADTETPNVSFAGTVYLQYGTDWNVAVDNISYDVRPTPTGVVPLPASLPLLAAGIAGVALLRRRTRV